MTLTLAHRFHGPPGSANGGYASGRVAALVELPDVADAAVEVTLRAPPPLDTPLRVEEGEVVRLWDGETLVAEGRPGTLSLADLDPPGPIDLATARERSRHYTGFDVHGFPTCFTCGPRREPGDGMRVFAGRIEPGTPVAAPWDPPADLFEDGALPEVFVWAALDCPGYFAVAERGEAAVLGRITGRVLDTPHPGETCIVQAWPLGREGRKLHAGTVAHGADGRVLGASRHTWILLKAPPAG